MRDRTMGTGDGLAVVLSLAWERLLPPLTLLAALAAGGWVGAPFPV